MTKKKVKNRNVKCDSTGNGFKHQNEKHIQCNRGQSHDNTTRGDEHMRQGHQKQLGTQIEETSLENIFPCWLPWILFPLTLAFRLWYVLQPQNWWILHPDEVFQTVEAAHVDAYGYGFRAYEYLPPITDLDNITLSEAQLLENKLGMYSLRTFILPKLLSWIMVTANHIGLDASPFLVMKVVHVFISSLLPLCVYCFSNVWNKSRDIGIMSAVFVAVSSTMNVYGTHTFVNSFISPFVFFAVVPFLQILQTQNDPEPSCKVPAALKESKREIASRENEATSQHTPHGYPDNDASGKQSSNGFLHNHDENANVIFGIRRERNMQSLNFCSIRCRSFETEYCQALLSTFNMRYMNEQMFMLSHVINNVGWTDLFSGLLLALCIYIRVDIVLLLLCMVIVHFDGFCHMFSRSVSQRACYYFAGSLLGTTIGGCVDYCTYGEWFLSPRQWLKFNVWNGSAGEIFGSDSFLFYIYKLHNCEPIFALIYLFLLLRYIISLLMNKSKRPKYNFLNYFISHRAENQSFIIFIILLLSFSCNSHKELRFLHNAIVFLYISFANAIYSLLRYIVRDQKHCQYSTFCIYLFISLIASSHLYKFSHMSREERRNQSYGHDGDSQDVNMCLDFIRRQDDVKGVFVDHPLHITGAYSILHKHVPIFACNMNDYMEYNHGNYTPENQKQESHFNKISDFVSGYNLQYLFKVLTLKTDYNFLIIRNNILLSDDVYVKVYEVGNFKILKRKENITVTNITDSKKIPVGSNATVLETEGYWLKHFGLYEKAEQRLIASNRLEPTRIGVFRLLMDMYQKLNQVDDYNSVLNACRQIHSQASCLHKYVPNDLLTKYHRK